ncbi:MAG: peptidase M49 [Ignavibacteriales bacterium]|nr:peptidase M49 [Ignavibacteriales bacterium]
MKTTPFTFLLILFLTSCSQRTMERKYSLERVGPARVVQLYADGFEQLSANEKIFTYYVSRAALASRDIAIDQHHRFALEIRDLLEGIITHSQGVDPVVYEQILTYTKLFWINNGPYDNITSKKFVLDCSEAEFRTAVERAAANGAAFESDAETLDNKLNKLGPFLFDPSVEPMMTNKTPNEDWIKGSGVNFYGEDLTQKEVERFVQSGNQRNDLNSKLVKARGRVLEMVWRAGGKGIDPGMYASDLEATISYLEQAIPYASGPYQQETLRKLIKYFRTGDLEDFRQYNIHWVGDTSTIDLIHGFIEVYLDPMGLKAEFESSLYWLDQQLSKSIRDIGADAQYFEDQMPWEDKYKKQGIKPLAASFVNIVLSSGGTGPVSPIGINLPNEQMVRERYGSKSVVLNNVIDAANKSGGEVLLNEFAYDAEEKDLHLKYGTLADNMLTALHEVLGHASGKTMVAGDPAAYLPGYYSTLEEGRADLVALWHIWDDKLIELGAIPNKDVARQMYDAYIRNALLLQLRRIPHGDQIEEDHMKNRQMVALYIVKNSDAVNIEKRDGKTYVKVVDYEKMKRMVGELLTEVMRIKAEGDLAASKKLIDTYGLKIDTAVRDEVLERIKHLDVASYNGYVMPDYEPVRDPSGVIVDVKVSYPMDLMKQMLAYSQFTKHAKQEARTQLALQ